MRFLLDANIPFSAKALFPKYHEAYHVRDVHLADAKDEDIIAWAKTHKAVLVTRDFDFANILNFPPSRYFGIIVLKIPSFYTASAIKRVLSGFIAKIDEVAVRGATIIVEETRFRIRREEAKKK